MFYGGGGARPTTPINRSTRQVLATFVTRWELNAVVFVVLEFGDVLL